MFFEWDLDELNEFAERISSEYEFETAIMTAAQNIARVLHQYLLVQTPVDTGNLRKMWSAGDNLLFTVDRVGQDYQVTLINTARSGSADGYMYGVAVNDGHRTPSGGWVMGRFFVERSVLQTESQVDSIIAKELERWWEGC